MGIYFAAYSLIFLASIWKVGKTPGLKRRNQGVFVFWILFSLLALRHPSMGTDLAYGRNYGYLGQFAYISDLPWRDVFRYRIFNYEQGYIVFNKLISRISEDPQFFLASCAAATLGPVLYTIYRRSHYPVLSVIIFMGLPTFLLQYSGIRQSIALGIIFVAMRYIQEHSLWKFLAAVFLAMQFHTSAWIFLAAYPIYHFPMRRAWRILTCFLPLAFFLWRYPLFQLLSKLLAEDAAVDHNNAITLFLVFYAVYLFCCIFSGEQQDIAGLKNLFLVACCIQALAGVNAIVIRAGYYYMNSLIFLLPTITGRMKNRENARILNCLMHICFMLFGLYAVYTSSWAAAYPYKWFWNPRF